MVTGTRNSKRNKIKTSNTTQPDVTENSTSLNQAVLAKAQRVYRISGKPNLLILFWLFLDYRKTKQQGVRNLSLMNLALITNW